MAKVDGRAVALVIAGAVAIAAPLAQKWEGFVPKAAPDPAAIPTYCYGETESVDPLRVYSKGECADKLRARMARDYAPPLLKCMPSFIKPELRNVFAAALDAGYNAGPVRVCARMAANVNAGRIKEACSSLRGWFVTARNRRTGERVLLKGLVSRRNDEADLCLKPVP